ncbi:MAG: hypothetical protein M0R30_01890 [Methanoregula sp.]|uniref:hypothetical protein n=1 Tax=Methanoregula sp. TaxID=2052170 RepID=UPI0025CBECA1|nr:hypothetical protein [Methanoregula sp.]MCK9630366.1 hypothetical protein [Methanoregula sp.]
MIKNQNFKIRRLVLAKKMFLHGYDHASGKDEISRMLAIHHFDNCVEMLLKGIAIKRGIEPRKMNFYFEELIQKIEGDKYSLPLKNQIMSQHTWRNQIQHEGDIPSFDGVQKYRNYTEDFFKEVCNKIFGTPFEKINLSQLIYDKKLSAKVRSAERAFEKNDFKRCMKLSEGIITHATLDIADIYGKAGRLTSYWTSSKEFSKVISDNYADRYKKEKFYKPVMELSQAMLQLGMSSTGMQFLDEYRMDFLKFMITLKKIDELSDDELKEEAQYSLNFVTNLILKWQEEKIFEEILF